ncbi:uncharacterized protein [Temnothorax longispinosus]|uniref:uncharacterized protein isoform X2 n=1 Tax=Temnothorax longispinosus TaxID=300112 RepID=UPI003A9956A9
MDHSYDKTYYTDLEDSQDMYSQDMDVSVTELNIESDATFIDVVRGYPHIYAKNLKDFKDKNVRERSWVEIASVMNCSVEDCQKRWIRLRDRFSKERRLRDAETRSGSGSTTGRKGFPLYENMMFLSEHIQSRKTYTNLQSANKRQPVINAHAALSCNSSSARTIQNPRSSISLSSSLSPSNSESRPFSSVSLASSRNTPSSQTCTRQQSSIPQNISLSRNSDLQSANQQQPAINAHAALSCISSSARTIQNPRSSISPSLSPSSPENVPFSSVSTSSRNTPSPQTCIPSRNSALLPAHSSSTQPSSHNVTIPATSPQSIVPPEFLSDFEGPTNTEASSQENISTPKRRYTCVVC